MDGKTIKWKASVISYGQMGESMKEVIKMTKSMAMVCLHGQMAKSLKEVGIMESNMDKVR